jgi:transposase-like protein
MPRGRSLTPDQLTAARRAYEAGASFREIAAEHGVSHATIRMMLRAVGVESRPVGRPRRPQPAPRPAVLDCAVTDFQARLCQRPPLRIPLRTREERRVHTWTAAELGAIEYELAAGRFTVAPRGRSGLPERVALGTVESARIAFYIALQRVRAAA